MKLTEYYVSAVCLLKQAIKNGLNGLGMPGRILAFIVNLLLALLASGVLIAFVLTIVVGGLLCDGKQYWEHIKVMLGLSKHEEPELLSENATQENQPKEP